MWSTMFAKPVCVCANANGCDTASARAQHTSPRFNIRSLPSEPMAPSEPCQPAHFAFRVSRHARKGRSSCSLPDRGLALPVQVPSRQLALVVQVRRTAESQHVARELVKTLLLAVRAGCRRALLAVVDERRILVLVGHEPSEVAAVASVRLERLVGRRLRARVLRSPLLIHEVDHHVARRGVDDVGRAARVSFLSPWKTSFPSLSR